MGLTKDDRQHSVKRFFFGTLLVMLSASFLTAGSSPSAQPKFLLEIIPSHNSTQPGTPVFKRGSAVSFIIRMRNNSEQTLHFALINPAYDYRAIVLDASGNRVPESDAYRKLREQLQSPLGVTTSRMALVELKPHETCTDTIEVSYLYDLSQTGNYSVQLERDSPPEIGTGTVTSNQVRISIEE